MKGRRGFTLVEVLIAVSILIALMGSMFGFMQNLLDSRHRALEHANMQLTATTLIDRLEADLLTCLVGDSKDGAGVAGDNVSIRVLSRSVAASLAVHGSNDPRVFGDLQRSEYRFNESHRGIEARQFAVSAFAEAPEPFWPLGEVAKVRFRFHDGSAWVDAFDSIEAGRLPVAVEVAVWFAPWPGEEEAAADVDETGAERLTFDTTDTFDESAYADFLEQNLAPPPPPDRVRIIALLDSAGSEEDGDLDAGLDDAARGDE